MLIVHVGFGKCGTTSLQQHVFSHLVELGLVSDYNPDEIKSSLGAFRRGDRTQVPILRDFFEANKNNKILVSLESLIGWNPAIWQDRLALNREAFPQDSTILITVRDPEAFLRSFYQQNLHQGHVVPPESYFLERNDYDRARLTARGQIAEIFSVDDMRYQQIVSDYAKSFAKVVVVPIGRINDLQFLTHLGLDLTSEQIATLQKNIVDGAVENRSFSQTAMRLTYGRETFLNGLGLKSLSSYDHDYRKRFLPGQGPSPRRGLFSRICRRALSFIRPPRWRWLMSRVVDRVWPYTSYKLPESAPRGAYFEENLAFVEDVKGRPNGIAIFEK